MPHGLITEKHRFLTGFLGVLALIGTLGLLPPAGAAEDSRVTELKKEAEREGKLVFVHSFTVTDVEVVAQKFEKKYPFIKLEFVHLNNPQIMNRVQAEQRLKKYAIDVINSKADAINVMQKMGFLAKYLSPERKYYPERFRDREGYWTDVYLTVYSVVYNTRLVGPHEAPTTYQDLLKPQWKGKIGINPLQYMWVEAVMKTMGKEEGMRFLEALARQKPVVRSGGPLNVMLTAAGELALALPINSNNVESVKAAGAAVDRAKIKPYYGDMHPIALAANAPHPNAGKLFIDYFLSQECQELSADFFKISSRTGVKSAIVRSEEITPVDPAVSGEPYQKLLKQLFVNVKN